MSRRKKPDGRAARGKKLRRESSRSLCSSGKRTFETERLAQREVLLARRLTERDDYDGQRRDFVAYQCDRCGLWHLTSVKR